MSGEKTVAVWKGEWLPRSETFIRNQCGALSRWRPYKMAWTRVGDGIDQPDLAALTPLYGLRFRGATRLREASRGSRLVTRVYADRMRRQDVRLVHAHFGTGAIDAQVLAEAADLPLIATFHGVDVTAAATGDRPATRRYRQRLGGVFEYATTLVAVSGYIADRLVDLGAPSDKVVVHHIGTPLSAAAPTPPGEGLLFVGRLVEKKGVGDLISAIASLPPRHRHVPLTVVGYGPLEHELRSRAAELGVDARFVGGVSSDEVARLMRGARAVCVPSRVARDGDTEGLPMVLLEAAAEHRPIVATQHSGIPEFVRHGETGLLSPEADVEALAGNLARVLEDDALAASLGEGARRLLEQEFDIRSQTRVLETIYDAAVARS